jgi:hypothetical protein
LHAMQALSQLSYSPTREARNVGKQSDPVKERVLTRKPASATVDGKINVPDEIGISYFLVGRTSAA